MLIKGKKVILKAIEEEDLPQLHQWANDPKLWYLLGGWHFPTSRESQKDWFQSLKHTNIHLRLTISTESHGLIGTTNLTDINWKDRNAFTGAMLGDPNIHGQGLGTDAVMALVRYAFEELGLYRLDTTIIAYNKPSIHVYRDKCGWIQEGVQREWYFRQNKRWDRLLMGITREDYFNHCTKTAYWDEKN